MLFSRPSHRVADGRESLRPTDVAQRGDCACVILHARSTRSARNRSCSTARVMGEKIGFAGDALTVRLASAPPSGVP
jgi:hypothetical protein